MRHDSRERLSSEGTATFDSLLSIKVLNFLCNDIEANCPYVHGNPGQLAGLGVWLGCPTVMSHVRFCDFTTRFPVASINKLES